MKNLMVSMFGRPRDPSLIRSVTFEASATLRVRMSCSDDYENSV